MKPWTERYGSIPEQEPESSERDKKDPERRRVVGVVGRFSEKEGIVSGDEEEDLGWGDGGEAER